LSGKTLSGTYTFDSDKKTVTMKGSTLNTSLTAYVTVTGSTMTLTFDADKLMTVLKTVSSAASSLNTTASVINTLASSYDGMRLGFELSKK
jgi:flagellar hook-basal body complex protein FliE